ncbi:hypothetical protein WJX82_003307 [Trebouxia sp. C0006]
MGRKGSAKAALACTLAVVIAACPSIAQTTFNATAVQFAAAEANGPANPSCGFGPLSLSSFPFGKAASINANSPFLEGLPQGGCGLCFQLTCEAGAQHLTDLANNLRFGDPLPGSMLHVLNVPQVYAYPPELVQEICENSNQPLVVQLVDSGTSNISIRAQDFTALAPAYLGGIPVSVQQANCSIAGNILIRILQYRAAGGGYIQLTFLNTIGGIDSVLLSASKANNFQPMYNQMAAVWVASNLPPPPLDVRIVSVTGQSVTAVGAITTIAAADVQTSVQFDATSQSSSASPAASGGVAVYTFPPSLPEGPPTPPESPAQSPPELHATDGPPPSSPLDGMLYDLKGIASNGSCLTLWQLIQLSPNLTSWADTIQAAGLVDAFNSSTQELTMFAPLNSAFQSLTVEVGNALANPDGSLETVSQYMASEPSLAQAIIGYQTVQGSHSLSLLRTQTQLNTTDSLRVNNASSVPLPLNVTVAGGNTAKVSGLQNPANVLQTDIPACGPNLLQLTDAVLLPVNFTDYVTSRITPGDDNYTMAVMVAG